MKTFSSDVANLHFDDASADLPVLHAAIAALTPDQRLAVNLIKLKEMSLKEAALASGRSVSALEGCGAPGHQGAAEATAPDEPNAVTRTRELVDTSVECATPVRRLRPPMMRATLWLAFAGLVLVLIAVGHGVRTDLLARLDEPKFAATIGAALATGIVATIAAFMISLPDRSRWWLVLPLPALAMWDHDHRLWLLRRLRQPRAGWH